MSNRPNRKPSHSQRLQVAAEERANRTKLIIGVIVVTAAAAVILDVVIITTTAAVVVSAVIGPHAIDKVVQSNHRCVLAGRQRRYIQHDLINNYLAGVPK